MIEPVKLLRVLKVKGGNAPDGSSAPNWVKDAWIGCTLPYEESEVETKDDPVRYMVRHDFALTALHKSLPAAARWYAVSGHPTPGRYFAFDRDDVELLSQDNSKGATVPLKR